MKKLFKKIISVSTSALMLASVTALQAFAGAAKGDEYDLKGIDASQSTVKPIISVTQTSISYYEAKANPVQTVEVVVSGADKKYANAGFGIKLDDRLKLVKDPDGDVATASAALNRSMFTAVPEGDNGFRAIITSSENTGKDGVMFSFQVELPSDFKGGEKYPIEIYYNSDSDLFTNALVDEEGQLMEAWTFTQGIEHGYIEIGSGPHDEGIFLKGDVNHDGKVDSVDASNILSLYAKIATEKTEIAEKQLKEYDYNGDGAVDSVDASQVLMVYTKNSSATVSNETKVFAAGRDEAIEADGNTDSRYCLWLDISKDSDYIFNGDFIEVHFKLKDNIPEKDYAVSFTPDFSSFEGTSLKPDKIVQGNIRVGGSIDAQDVSSENGFVVYGDNVSANAGDEVVYRINLKNNPGMAAVLVWINYDKDAMEAEKVIPCGEFAEFASTATTGEKPEK